MSKVILFPLLPRPQRFFIRPGSYIRLGRAYAILLALLLSGCMSQNPSEGTSSCAVGADLVGFEWFGSDETRTGGPWETVLAVPFSGNRPPIPRFELEEGNVDLVASGPNSSLYRVSIQPPSETGNVPMKYTFRSTCDPYWERSGSWSFYLETPSTSRTVQPGMGVLVWAAAFESDGPLLWTNIRLLAESDWPKAPGFIELESQWIPIYVYDQDASERPPIWMNPGLSATGDAFGYETTAKAFNEALKGASDKANTLALVPGAEAHFPGGPPLETDGPVMLWIKVATIQVAPCPHPNGAAIGCEPLPDQVPASYSTIASWTSAMHASV